MKWAELEDIELFRAQPLTTHIKISRQKLIVPRTVHVEGRRRLYFADAEDLGQPDAGERILAPFVAGEIPAMVDFAWSYAWREAEDSGAPDDELILASQLAEDSADPLQAIGDPR